MKVSFGQDKQKKARSSPNRGLIRTGQAEKSEIQSEWRSHLDRTSRKMRDPVRMKVSFGQDKQKKADPVRMDVSFGQNKQKIGRSSPKRGLIRTGQAEKSEIQSE
jgi:hypothetical protein